MSKKQLEIVQKLSNRLLIMILKTQFTIILQIFEPPASEQVAISTKQKKDKNYFIRMYT